MKKPSLKSSEDKLERLKKLCKDQGVPLTVQRRVILENLATREDHPTADLVFEEVGRRLPGLSRTTVYRVLENFVKWGIVHKASHLGSAARYDPRTDRHHHLSCMGCEKVLDMEEGAAHRIEIPKGASKGFEILDYSVHFKGYCADCLKRMRKSRDERVSPREG